jgi:hypothetical protein
MSIMRCVFVECMDMCVHNLISTFTGAECMGIEETGEREPTKPGFDGV